MIIAAQVSEPGWLIVCGDGLILKPAQCTRHVNDMQTEAELKALRRSLARGTPFRDTRRRQTLLQPLALNPRFQLRTDQGSRKSEISLFAILNRSGCFAWLIRLFSVSLLSPCSC